jgi:hypothetical protein
MRLFNDVAGILLVVSFSFLVASDASAAKPDEFADTRVCVKLGLETNHPFKKVCTRKVATVEAAKWTQEKESIHFVYLKSGEAFTAGHIKPKMDGGTAFEKGQLDFCVMEVPAFRGSDAESLAHNTAIATAYYYAARDTGNDFTGAKSIKMTLRNKSGMFPENCDVVAATGEAWKKAWTRVVEQVSLNSSRNSKFGQDYKGTFTTSLNDLSLAFTVTPGDVQRGSITAKNEAGELEQERNDARAAIGELLANGSTDGLAFLEIQNSSTLVCHNYSEHDTVMQTLNANNKSLGLLSEWGIKDGTQYQTVEEVFQATMASECRAIVSTPADLAQLQASLQKRDLTVALGWVHFGEEELMAGRELAIEAKRVANIEAQEQAERDRLAAVEREKEMAAQAERNRVAAIARDKASAERAKTHPYTAIVSCTTSGIQVHILSCFNDTELKITTNNRSRIYPAWEIQQLGQSYNDGLHIELPENFSIKAQNGTSGVILGVQIVDQYENVIYEDQATQYQVVFVGN